MAGFTPGYPAHDNNNIYSVDNGNGPVKDLNTIDKSIVQIVAYVEGRAYTITVPQLMRLMTRKAEL